VAAEIGLPMGLPLKHIVVVGGGSAGWLAAACLNRMLNRYRPGQVDVTVIESDDDGTIGAGEATIPSLVQMLKTLGADEREFMRATHATFMHGSRFVNWLDEPAVRPGSFYHLHDRPQPVDGVDLAQVWLSNPELSPHREYACAVSVQATLCERMRSPKLATSRAFEAPVSYAYHVDSVLLGRYLRDLALSRGVRRIADTVAEVVKDEAGGVRALRTVGGAEVAGDFYVDCSGIVVQGALNEPFLSYGASLACDRVVAISTPIGEDVRLKPCTTATALSSGWTWDIQLSTHRSTGYVYSSAFIPDDEAERELRAFIGPAANAAAAHRNAMRSGRNRNLWVGNCLAAGPAGGCIEPLESTGIHLVETGLRLFVDYLPQRAIDPVVVSRYNEHMASVYDEVMEFLVMHYCLTRREDTAFWRACRHEAVVPARLREDLQMWQQRLPSRFDRSRVLRSFGHESCQYLLAGMDRLPPIRSPYEGYLSPELMSAAFQHVEKVRAQAVAVSPDHTDFIRALNAEDARAVPVRG